MPTVTTPKTEHEVIDFCEAVNATLGEKSDRMLVWCEVKSYLTGTIPTTYLETYGGESDDEKQLSLKRGQTAEYNAFKKGTDFTTEFNNLI